MKVAQELAKKLRNYKEFVAKKQIEPDNWELMNCFCNTLLWVGYWLEVRIDDPESASSSGASDVPSQPFDYSESQRNALQRFGISAWYTIYQEHHARDCQEIEEQRRNCCKQADRVRQWRIDELSLQKKENPSSVNLVSDGECLVARTFFSVLSVFVAQRTLVLPTHMRWLKASAAQDESFCACHSWVFQAVLPSGLDTFSKDADWNQTKPVRDSTVGGAVWPSGRSDPNHRLCAQTLHRCQQSAHADPFPVQENSFNLESFLTNTVVASEDSDHVPQRLAASGSQHSVVSTVPTRLSPGSFSSARKLVRGSDSVASVEESVFRWKRDRA